MHRADIDDRAAVLRVHVVQAGARGQERAIQMDCQHPLPVGERKLMHRPDDLDAGIAHQHVDPAESLRGFIHPGLHLCLVGHVHRHGHCRSAGCRDLGRGPFGGFGVHVGDRDMCALTREAGGDFLADAAGRTSDDRNLAIEPRHVRFSCLSLDVGRKSAAHSATPFGGMRFAFPPYADCAPNTSKTRTGSPGDGAASHGDAASVAPASACPCRQRCSMMSRPNW